MNKSTSFSAAAACCLTLLGSLHGADKLVLRPHWEAGKTYQMKSEIQMDMTVPNAGAQKTNITQTMNLDVTSETGTGNKIAEMKIVGVRAEMGIMGQTMVYDSSDPSKSNPLLEKSMGAMLNKSLTLVFDADDNYVEARGIEAFQPPGAAGKGMSGKDMADMFRKSFESSLPKQAVAPGDTWTTDEKMNVGPLGALTVKMDAKFEDIEDHNGQKCAKIVLDGKLSTEGGSGPVPASIGEGSKMHGEVFFDIAKRLPSESITNAEMSITVGGQTLPMKQKITTSVSEK